MSYDTPTSPDEIWSYELASYIHPVDGSYSGWTWCFSPQKPVVPLGSVRNLTRFAPVYEPLTPAEVEKLTCMQAGAPWAQPTLAALVEVIAIYDKLRAEGKRPFDPASLPQAEHDAYWKNADAGVYGPEYQGQAPAEGDEPQRYSPDGEGGMEIDSLGGWIKYKPQPKHTAAPFTPQELVRMNEQWRGRIELCDPEATPVAQAPAPAPERNWQVYNADGSLDMVATMKNAAAIRAMDDIRTRIPSVAMADECDRAMLAYAICPELRTKGATQAPAVKAGPLTPEQIDKLVQQTWAKQGLWTPLTGDAAVRFVRAIERAHHIGVSDTPVHSTGGGNG